MINPFKRIAAKFVKRVNIAKLEHIANLSPHYVGGMHPDELVLLDKLGDLIEAKRLVTRKGNVIYAVPDIEHVTLWQMIEARRAEDASALILGWCKDYAPDTVADLLQVSKYIKTQLDESSELERVLFEGLPSGGGSNGDPIKEAETVLCMVQLVAELMNCSFDEAKATNYMDAILAISKRSKEVERAKAKQRNNQ